jgi:hypothetical protein
MAESSDLTDEYEAKKEISKPDKVQWVATCS